METEPRWVKRWNMWTAPRPSRPGVWRRKEGGYLVRGKVTDPRTGRRREILRVLPHLKDAAEAQTWLLQQTAAVKTGRVAAQRQTVPRFRDYAISVIERKTVSGEYASMKTLVCLESMMKHHLLPAFGDFFVDRLVKADVEAWKVKEARRGKYSAVTVNNVLRVLKTFMSEAAGEFDFRDSVAVVKPLDTSTLTTYTEEEPNSLTVGEVPVFLRLMKERQPDHFAMVALGFATGLRPSTLRPLRRSGPKSDVLWDEGVLLVRRSHTVGDAAMETTKQGVRYRISLPAELMRILRWHVDRLPDGRMRDSDLLFPSLTGGFRSTTVLIKPFADVCEKMKLKKHITPKAMRRTFQDLCRAAEVQGQVQRSICGHLTEEMTERYSSIGQAEIRTAVGKVISLAGFREALETAAASAVGGQVGGHESEKKKAG